MLRIISLVFIGGAVTFGLFALMAKLIANSDRPPEKSAPPPVVAPVMQEDDSDIDPVKSTPPPPPPPPSEPPKLEQIEPNNDDQGPDVTIDIDPQFTDPTIDILDPTQGRPDTGATPIVRVDPKYPVDAARDGKEGWVKLSFTINETGNVEDVKVIESQPRRTFDREAQRALKKWKYKPKIEGGQPVKQFNQKVQLDFSLDES